MLEDITTSVIHLSGRDMCLNRLSDHDMYLFSLLLSVSVLIFNTTSHCFVLVKQFRPGKFSPHKATDQQHCVMQFIRFPLVTILDLDCYISCGHFH